jgi:hypothetical protein
MRDWAQQLLAYEAGLPDASASDIPLVSRVLDSLRRPLVTLAGLNCWCLLLARALASGKAQTNLLRAARIGRDGGLEGYQPGKRGDRETDVILIAQLLGLLASLVGEGATLRIVAGVWPGLRISDTEPSGENEHGPGQ